MKHQSGRSMVEILGVLAIIGVLSVGGLAAYNYAMDKKVVNDLMYDMELATTEIWTSGTTGPGYLGEEMDVSVLGENHPNIRVLKLQHMENGEIVLDEADGEITEEYVAAVENDEEPAFLIEIHDITVAQCVQLLRNQDKLNTPFPLEDSDGTPFNPEKGDDPQDFCERIFGKDDPVAFGLISNAYAKESKALRIPMPRHFEEDLETVVGDAKCSRNGFVFDQKQKECVCPSDRKLFSEHLGGYETQVCCEKGEYATVGYDQNGRPNLSCCSGIPYSSWRKGGFVGLKNDSCCPIGKEIRSEYVDGYDVQACCEKGEDTTVGYEQNGRPNLSCCSGIAYSSWRKGFDGPKNDSCCPIGKKIRSERVGDYEVQACCEKGEDTTVGYEQNGRPNLSCCSGTAYSSWRKGFDGPKNDSCCPIGKEIRSERVGDYEVQACCEKGEYETTVVYEQNGRPNLICGKVENEEKVYCCPDGKIFDVETGDCVYPNPQATVKHENFQGCPTYCTPKETSYHIFKNGLDFSVCCDGEPYNTATKGGQCCPRGKIVKREGFEGSDVYGCCAEDEETFISFENGVPNLSCCDGETYHTATKGECCPRGKIVKRQGFEDGDVYGCCAEDEKTFISFENGVPNLSCCDGDLYYTATKGEQCCPRGNILRKQTLNGENIYACCAEDEVAIPAWEKGYPVLTCEKR